MSAGQRVRRSRSSARPRRSPIVVVGVAALALAIAAGAWVLSRPSLAGEGASGTTGLPGPLGGSSVAVDVNTLVGKSAPAFTLSDSDGTSYAVTPGQGKPIVLISHMGIT
jgi:hypothetical protein